MPETDLCFVCRKHRGEVVVPGGPIYEDDLVFSGHSWSVEQSSTPYLGSFIVEPKRHVPTWAELNDDEAAQIGRLIRDVSRALKQVAGAEHIYVFVLGHNVPHLHAWVLPRLPDPPREFWGLQLFEWPERPAGTAADVEALCEEMRTALLTARQSAD
ncbi:MAG: HIT domain-containing protein [Anaerolineales bacterium]